MVLGQAAMRVVDAADSVPVVIAVPEVLGAPVVVAVLLEVVVPVPVLYVVVMQEWGGGALDWMVQTEVAADVGGGLVWAMEQEGQVKSWLD